MRMLESWSTKMVFGIGERYSSIFISIMALVITAEFGCFGTRALLWRVLYDSK